MNKCIGIVRGTIVHTRITGSICQTGYIVLPGNYRYYTDDIAIWRKGVRGNYFVYDKALTPMGFDGVENVDWVNVETLMA